MQLETSKLIDEIKSRYLPITLKNILILSSDGKYD